MEILKRTWFKVPGAIRKPFVLVVGTAVVLAGLIMLVIPGPGWAAIFLGFAILATEFAAAQKINNKLVGVLKWLIAYGKKLLFEPWVLP